MDNFERFCKNQRQNRIKAELSLLPLYRKWFNYLANYTVRLFEWTGLPETAHAEELEIKAQMHGYAPIVTTSIGWIVPETFSRFGITDYYDEFTKVRFSTPLRNGVREVNKNAVILKNDSLYNNMRDRLDYYAMLLAHSDVSFVCELVNDRSVNNYEVINEKEKKTIEAFRESAYFGYPDCIINKGFEVAKPSTDTKRSNGELDKILSARNNILTSFFEEIGIKKGTTKKERLVEAEVESDNILLKLNIADMYKQRVIFAKRFSEISGYNVAVKCNVDYDNTESNESEVEKNEIEREI